MRNTKIKGLLLLLCCLLAVICWVSFSAAAVGEDLTFEIEREMDDWEYDPFEWCTVTVKAVPDRQYTGSPLEPAPEVFVEGTRLKSGEDYDVSYEDNLNAGTAWIYIEFYWPYDGEIEVPFRILPVDAGKAVVSPIPDQYYDGWELEPDITATLNGHKLECWEDFYPAFSNNIYPGQASVTLRFDGNYTGEITRTFSIVVPPVQELTGSAYGLRVSLEWTGSSDVSSYLVERYDDAKKKYVKRGTTTYAGFGEDVKGELTTFRYRVFSVLKANGKTWKSKAVNVSVLSGLDRIRPSLTKLNKKVKIKWTPNAKVDGYLIYRVMPTDEWDFYDDLPRKRIAKITDPAQKSYVDKKVKNETLYAYAVCSYKKVGKKTIISDTAWAESTSVEAVLSGVKKSTKRTYDVYNAQGSKTKLSFQVRLSDRDISILDNFAKKHFKKGWSDRQKLEYTLGWINGSVTYALGKQWTKIESKSYVEAIFKYKLGQCVQYNGAMAAMMIHLGYPARLIMGFRGSWPNDYIQHFWVEAPINGSVYVVECGNAGRSGYWFYFFEPYANTFGYIKNKKNL